MVSPTEFYASINNSTYSKKLGRHLYSLVNIQVATAMATRGLVYPWRQCVGPDDSY